MHDCVRLYTRRYERGCGGRGKGEELPTRVSALSGTTSGNFPAACTTPNVGYRPIVYFLWQSSSFSPSRTILSHLIPSDPPSAPARPTLALSLTRSLCLSLLSLATLPRLSSNHRIILPSHTSVLIPSYHPRPETRACSLVHVCVGASVPVLTVACPCVCLVTEYAPVPRRGRLGMVKAAKTEKGMKKRNRKKEYGVRDTMHRQGGAESMGPALINYAK